MRQCDPLIFPPKTLTMAFTNRPEFPEFFRKFWPV